MSKQILSEEFCRMQRLAGIITESQYKLTSTKVLNEDEKQNPANNQELTTVDPKIEKELKNILKADYPTFVQKLGDNIKDPKFIQAIKSIADKDPIQTTDISPKVTALKPTQNEIDVDRSLKFPLTDAQSAAVCLKGGTVSINGLLS